MLSLPDIKAYSGNGEYIFVSYAHADKEKVYPFIAALQKKYNVWFDEGIHYGQEWEEEISARLKHCAAFIFIVSETSLKSVNCKDELYHARRLEKAFINILIDGSIELPDWFSFRYGRFQMCNLFTFSSPESAVVDLERKCEWLAAAKMCVEEAKGNHIIGNGVEAAKPNPLYVGNAEVGEIIRFGRYTQKEGGALEPIEWLVLNKEGNKALLISKYALDCQRYNTSRTNVTWETCSLRKWLNGTFLSTAFSPEERNSIISSTVIADKNPSYSTSPGNNTTDKVFLLSLTEVYKYFIFKGERKCAPTDYAIAQGVLKSDSHKTGGRATCWWWLRSPGRYSYYAAGVGMGGAVYFDGDIVSNSNSAARPALWINLGS